MQLTQLPRNQLYGGIPGLFARLGMENKLNEQTTQTFLHRNNQAVDWFRKREAMPSRIPIIKSLPFYSRGTTPKVAIYGGLALAFGTPVVGYIALAAYVGWRHGPAIANTTIDAYNKTRRVSNQVANFVRKKAGKQPKQLFHRQNARLAARGISPQQQPPQTPPPQPFAQTRPTGNARNQNFSYNQSQPPHQPPNPGKFRNHGKYGPAPANAPQQAPGSIPDLDAANTVLYAAELGLRPAALSPGNTHQETQQVKLLHKIFDARMKHNQDHVAALNEVAEWDSGSSGTGLLADTLASVKDKPLQQGLSHITNNRSSGFNSQTIFAATSTLKTGKAPVAANRGAER